MNSMIKTILTVILMLTQVNALAELPSWGMTENQYKMPNFETKMGEIGKQAYNENWLLKITAPKDWHGKIRTALTNTGERDVQVTFKDSLYQSIAISAAKGAKIAKISPSTTNTTVQKQVVIDKPEIDTEVEAPDFGDTSFKNNSKDLLENIEGMEISVPNATHNVVKATAEEVVESNQSQPSEAVVEPASTGTKEVATVTPEPTTQVATTQPPAANVVEEEDIEANKEVLRKRHARTKRVDKELTYDQINSKDEMFIKDSVVLIKRFVNQGVVLYFWMKEDYDPQNHKLIEKGSGKYKKDDEAIAGETPEEKAQEQVVEEVIKETNLDFIAVDDMVEDQDDLRRDYGRNKRVDHSINASQLKEDDVLYVQNQTVLVVRPITRSQNVYLWLVGDTTINREVERKDDNMFIIK